MVIPGLDRTLDPLRDTIRPEIDATPDSDSETEQAGTNTVGNIPMEWYKDFDHIGYDLDGKPITKSAIKDELDKFLANVDDPDAWKTVRDELQQEDVVLSSEDLEIIKRMREGRLPDVNYDPYAPLVEFFSSKTSITPVTGGDEPKRRFIRSKWEAKRIMQLVRYIRHGVIRRDKHKVAAPRFFDLWRDAPEEATERGALHIPAPKMALPGNEESYNPPEEYLPDEKERRTFERTEPSERKQQWLPQKFSTLRHVPAFDRFVQERFERCLDLYLAPRVRKNRVDVDPESLMPKLPDPKDLEPYPTRTSITYRGHEGRIRSFTMDPAGQWMVSGSDDQTARLWEVSTGRCLSVWNLGAVVQHVAWNPSSDLLMLSIAAGDKVYLVSPTKLWDTDRRTVTEDLIDAGFRQAAPMSSDETYQRPSVAFACRWDKPTPEQKAQGILAVLVHRREVKQIAWHRKGDYFATIQPEADDAAVLIHQLAKQQTQRPFRRTKGAVQRISFHPTKPLFFVATQRYVRIYNLQKQSLVKALQSNVKWISSLDVHPTGDNLIVGSYDKRVCWFDLDLSARPYRTLRYHGQAVRSVAFHKRYPLFASCGDDGNLHVFHGMVYNDLLQNPLIVPVKILRGHQVVDSLGVLHCEFHPTQPWLVSAGADRTLRLWC
ncbi:NUC169 domain-containing protein [Thamnocephalis sphaerospora]|uniref:Ribosome biogenesis protein ERB1 n=1 Tax=Thamnocephalis sphaerospora TaxID=78915 RepID=A0A4P9XUH4_9FUNG|nr:NUC169 domain-containing protein [Thamnocephalis sphaerospora]|eukprot:RKP09863.1 NUC169 domain-containing protein [Thamnocephalis sphaerospora]